MIRRNIETILLTELLFFRCLPGMNIQKSVQDRQINPEFPNNRVEDESSQKESLGAIIGSDSSFSIEKSNEIAIPLAMTKSSFYCMNAKVV